MLLLPYQGDKGTGLTKSLKIKLKISIFLLTFRHNLHFGVNNVAPNLMLRIKPNLNINMTLFILENVQNRIVLITLLVNLPGESLSEL